MNRWSRACVTLRERIVVITEALAPDERQHPRLVHPVFKLRAPRMRGDTLLLDQGVPGATLEIGAQELVGHVPVAKEERRVRGEPLLELQTVVAMVEDRIVGKDKPLCVDGELVGPERRRRRADHFERGIPDDIGQLRRVAGRLARIFAEFQAAGRGKIGHIIGVRNLVPGNGGPFRHDAAGETNQDEEAKEEQETDGEGASGLEGHLWLTEGPHISQHLPGFFFRQYERNKWSHRRSLTAILQNPEQFPIGSSCLPLLVGEISR